MQKEIEKAGIATYLDHDAYNNYIPTLNVILDLKSDDDISSASEDYEHVIKLITYSDGLDMTFSSGVDYDSYLDLALETSHKAIANKIVKVIQIVSPYLK